VGVVDFLRERLFAGFGGYYVIADRRNVGTLSKARGDLLLDRREAGINMM
jgi:hypothetical protein